MRRQPSPPAHPEKCIEDAQEVMEHSQAVREAMRGPKGGALTRRARVGARAAGRDVAGRGSCSPLLPYRDGRTLETPTSEEGLWPSSSAETAAQPLTTRGAFALRAVPTLDWG
jgi:hypothetical protein